MTTQLRSVPFPVFTYWIQANEKGLNEERHGEMCIFGAPQLVPGLTHPLISPRVFFALRIFNLGSARIEYFRTNQCHLFLCSLADLGMCQSRIFRYGILQIFNRCQI